VALLEHVQQGNAELVAPEVVVAELGHVLRKLVVRKKLAADGAVRALDRFLALAIPLRPARDLAPEALRLAIANTATFYDALYIALAVREDLRVITADKRMRRAFAKLDRTILLADFRLP